LENKAEALTKELAKPIDDGHAWMESSGATPWSLALDMLAQRLSNRRVLSQSAVALELLNSTGKLPAKLPLTGDTALDPLGMGPLHYQVSKNGFTVYGVGAGGVDHRGRSRDERLSFDDYDVVFTYPAKPEPKLKVVPPRRVGRGGGVPGRPQLQIGPRPTPRPQ